MSKGWTTIFFKKHKNLLNFDAVALVFLHSIVKFKNLFLNLLSKDSNMFFDRISCKKKPQTYYLIEFPRRNSFKYPDWLNFL